MFRTNKIIRKGLAFFLCITLLFVCVPFSAFAESESSDDNQTRLIVPQGTISVVLTKVAQLTSNKRIYSISVIVGANLNFTEFSASTLKLYKGPSSSSSVSFTQTGLSVQCSPAASSATMSGIGTVTITANSNGDYVVYATTTNARMNFIQQTGWYSGWRSITDLDFDAIYGS